MPSSTQDTIVRQYPDRPIVAVGAAVCREGRVLIVQRGKAPSKGVWTVPGGAVHLGETMRQAAAREVEEECGIQIEVGEVVGILDNIIRDKDGAQPGIRYHYAIVDFAAQHVSGELAPSDELMGAAWVDPSELDAYRVPAKAQHVLLKALALYR
jgi:ADP-ribose pyrophosphatase YjhB (NUDIX family)